MVAIVTGNGLGLQSSSALGLGARGQLGTASFGQAGEQVYVNAANGNLMVQDRDLMLIGRGVDGAIHRAYNSQGRVAADGWRPGGARAVGELAGKLNEAGSTVTRTDWDGSAITYGYDAQRRLYVATSGTGARATLAYDAGLRQWAWQDGGKRLSECYDAVRGGRLISATDSDGNRVDYAYDGAGLLSRVRTANGELTYLDYASGRLARLRAVYTDNSGSQRTSTAVHYGYDAAGRLSAVTVDLSPDDNSIADGRAFTTTYRYDGNSDRVASITQSDGAELAFTYALLGGEYRVASVAQRADGGTARVTRLAYDLDARRTTITDPFGAATVLAYDAQGRLVESVPPAGGVQRFHYDAAGSVVKVEEAGGGIEYRYDANGNRVWQRDAAGGVVEWRYGANNELLEEVAHLGKGADEHANTTYVYDARRHLRFVVDPQRRVTEYRYNAFGQQISVLTYAGAGYEGAAFGEAELTRWVAGLVDKSTGTRTDTAYDFRGNVASITRYGRLLKDGSGDARAGAGEVTQTRYVYDPFGRLLQRHIGAPGKQQAEQFAYDGLGRMLSARRFDGTLTLYRYDDARHQTIVTFSSGLTRTSTFNAAGELVALVESAADVLLSQVGYRYDAAGRLRMETDALGQRTHYLHDAAGRKIAQIDAGGGLTEYVYTPAGQIARTIRYATPLAAAHLDELANADGSAGAAVLARVRPTLHGADQVEWRAYDGAGRLARSVNGDGALTEYRYDDAGRLLRTVQYATRVGTSGGDPTAGAAPAASSADRNTRYFYDAGGLLSGQLDAEGYLTEYQYDMSSRRIATIRYATAVADARRASTSVLDFRPPESANDIREQASYDARGLLRREIDGEGHSTEYEYDEFGNVAQRVRSERVDPDALRTAQTVRLTFDAKLERPKLTGAVLTIRVDGRDVGKVDVMSTTAQRYAIDIADLVPDEDHRIEFIFGSFMDDATVQNAMFGHRLFAQPGTKPNGRPSGRLEKSQNYVLDAAGTVKSWLAASTKQERTTYRYDAMGRLLERTTGTMLGASATRYTYDSEGRVTSETTGDRTRHYRYDIQGRLSAQLSGEGAAALATLGAKPTAAQVDAVWQAWGERYAYDAAGRRTASTDAQGRRTLYFYDAAGRATHRINALGEVAEQRYDALGNLTQTIAYAKRMERDALDRLSGGVLTDAVRRAVFALGDDRVSRATFGYDRAGRVAWSTDAEAFVTWRTYDVLGNEIATRQELSAGRRSIRAVDYDRLGRAVRTTVDPGGLNLATRAVYDAFGREIETVDADGVVRRREYDRNGNTVVMTDGLGKQGRMTYDAFGNVLTRTDRAGATTRYAYAPDKRQLTVSMPDGVETTTTYDEFGQTIAVTDGRGAATKWTYDRDGRQIDAATPAGVTRQRYDRVGQLIETTDGRGVRTTYRYDAAGRVLTRTLDPDGLNLVTRYAYDAKGSVVRTTEPSGTVVVTEYDLNGRRAAVVTDAGEGRLNLRTTFAYDGAGKVLTVTDGAGTAGARMTRHEYDAAGRLVRTIVDPNGLALATAYRYDGNGNVIRVIDAAGGVTRYGYDAENRRICEIDPTGAVVLSRVDAEGRVVARTQYATPNAGLLDDAGGVLSVGDLESRIAASPGRDRTTRHVYDINGRVRYTFDALGALTEFRYDGNGNTVSVARHGKVFDAAQPATETAITDQLRRLGVHDSRSESRVTRTVYDAANRAAFVIDPLGNVTQNCYDANGNLVERVNTWRSAWLVMAGFSEPTEKDLLDWVRTEKGFISTRVATWRYDSADRVTESVDAEGYLTRHEYDGTLLRKIVRYGDAVDAKRGMPVGPIEKLLPAKPAVAATAVTEYRHDGAGRITAVVDAAGVATHYVLDAFGRAVETIAAAGTDRQLSTRATFDAAGRMTREVRAFGSAEAATFDYRYDAFGNVIARIDPRGVELAESDSDWALSQRKALGYVDEQNRALVAAALTAAQRNALIDRYATHYRYDAAGRLTEETNPLGDADRTTYDAFGDAVERVTKGVAAKLFYDGLGRVVAQVNPDGAVVRTEYSASGQPIRVARFERGTLDWSALAANGEASAVLSRLQGSVPAAVTLLEYDKLDRLVKSTDAEGGVESYGYNGFGDRIFYQNKVGAVFQYGYDNRGLLISETLPVTSKNRTVQNFHLYDAAGNRTATIEAGELPEQRTTRFEYDTLGRLIRQSGDALTIRTASGETRTTEPLETRAYDARGNLVRQADANGNTTTWYYDAANRRIAEVSATGTLTLWTYDAAGNRIATRVFGDPVAPTNGAEPPAPIDASRVRETRYCYDENNRLVESRVLGVATGYFDPSAGETQRGEYFITSGSDLVTRYRYDGAGRLIEQTDPAGNRTLSFYDRMGNKLLEVDGAGYGIRWERDAEGRVLTETRFASRYPDPIAPNSALAETLAANWPTSADDRITHYTWDGNGRLTSETRQGVRHAVVDGNGWLEERLADATSRYVYDGEGHLLRKTDANGSQFDFTYDALGRQTSQMLPQFVDHLNRQVRSRISFEYDGLNQIVKETKHGDANQVTTYVYGAGGRLASKTNALGVVTQFGYDAVGNTVLVSYLRADADGRQQLDETGIAYDAAQRETSRITRSRNPQGGAVLKSGVLREQHYNAFGEVVARRTGGGGPNGEWQEYADYNNAGWVVRSNFGDGVSRLFLHDRNGNATLKVESMQTDLRGLTIETGEDLEKLLQKADMMQTFTRYDARNQVIQVRQPKTSGSVPHISFSPVDIPIDGGVFANTQLSISGWIEKQSRPVAGPVQPSESGTIVGSGTAGLGPVSLALNWRPQNLSPLSMRFSVESIDLRLQDLPGEFNLEARVSWEIADSNGGFPQTGSLTSMLPSKGGLTQIPLGLDFDRRLSAASQFKYKLEIYATPKNGDGGADLVGSTDQQVKLTWPNSGQELTSTRTGESLVYLSAPTSRLMLPPGAMVGLNWASTSLSWIAIGFTVKSLDMALPDLKGAYGAYDLEARVSWQVGNSDYKPETGNFTAALPSDGGSASIEINRGFGRFRNDAFFKYTLELYAKPKSGNGAPELIGLTTQTVSMWTIVNDHMALTQRKDGEAFFGLNTPTNQLTVAQHSLPDGARGALYYRPAGSNSSFQQLPKAAGSQPNSFSVDSGSLPAGDYDMVFMAVSDGSDGRATGTLLRRDGYRVHIEPGGNASVTSELIPGDRESSRPGFLADASGSYIWTSPHTLNLYSPRDSALHLADHVVVKVRQQGTVAWNEARTVVRDPVTGAFAIDLSGYGPGNWDVEFDLYDAAGQKLDAVLASVGLPADSGAPSLSTNYLADLKSTIVFHSQPADTDYLMVSWVQDGVTRYSRITRLGNGDFAWDVMASGLIPRPGSYTYAIKYTAYDSAGVPLAMGAGDITIGTPGISRVTLTGSQRPSLFEFKPTGTDGLPLTNVNTMTLYYRQSTVKDQAYDRPFAEVTLTRDAKGRFLFDASALPTHTEFEYRYLAKDAGGNVLVERQSYLLTGTRNNPITNVDIVGVIEQTAKDMTIDRMQSHNAFQEVSAERDGRGNWTYLSYNTMGALTLKREPTVRVTLANGAQIELAPETKFYYDLLGNLVGTRDANGNLSTRQWNYGQQQPAIAKSWDALGYSKVFQYDGLGNLRTSTDELNRRTEYAYDAGNRLIEIARPVLANGRRSIERFEYDSSGNRIARIDALGGRERTYYDGEGRIIRTVSAAGRDVRYDYRWASTVRSVGSSATGGWVKTTTDANGRTMVDEKDLFGRLTKHTDLGGRVFLYAYNWAGLLTKQTGSSGQDVDYMYYSHGMVRSIVDNATKTQSLYEYDGDGNRTAEYFTNFGDSYIFAQSVVEYDALNRVVSIKDNAYQVAYEYDAVGNRRRMLATYTDMVGYHEKNQDYWYEYDALNRFTVTMGSLSGECPIDPNDVSVSIVPGAADGDGLRLGYNAAGERILAVYAKDGRTERYTYDANGYLETQSINGVVAQERTNDLLGRAVRVLERRPDNGQVVSEVTRSWDADSILLSERDRVAGNATTYTRMADGTVARVDVKPDDAKGTRSSFVYEYEWWDGAKQSKITAQGTNPNAPGWRPASSWFNYDVNGNLKSTYDDGGNQPGNGRAFTYWTDLRGQVQRRDELVNVRVDGDGRIVGAAGDRKHNYYYLNGNRVGNQGNDGIDQVDYVKELAGKLQKGNDSQYKVFTPVGTADFDESFMTINGVYPGTSPGMWTVRDGDSLKSIASALWGDETLWYVLADANGLKSTDELKAGRLLTVPNKVTNVHNTASTFKPYDPGKAIGNTQPTLPDPPPPSRGGGCGGFLPVIAIVVAVVATVFTAGALTAPAGASFSAMMSAGGTALTGGAGLAGVGAAAVGGAVGAASAQGVMIAGGAQSGLDWKGIALGAVGGAVTAGAGGALGVANNVQTAVTLGAARSVATQGIGVATGLQHSFDWKGVAASAIASGVGYAATQAIGQLQYGDAWREMTSSALRADEFNTAVRGFGAGMAAGAASTVVRGGSLGRNVGAITMDAIASTVGNLVVDNVQTASLGKTDFAALRMQQAIAGVNEQILPVGLGSGFVAPETPYSGNAALYGPYGGLVDNSHTSYSLSSTLYGSSMGIATAHEKTPLSGEPFRAQFNAQQPGVLIAGGIVPGTVGSRQDVLGLGTPAQTQNPVFWDALKAPKLSLLDGTPKLVPLDGRAAQRAGDNAAFLRFMETQGTQPLGGLMANAAMQATGNAGYAVTVADTAGPLDALWAPAGARTASVASVRRGGGVPYGFENLESFSQFGSAVRVGLGRAGYGDVEPILQGSAITGKSFRTGRPFDVGRVSDFDVGLASQSLLKRA
ncbi:TPA: LysM peptidoglycan-binding domain-containing protein, partial [Burkholderia cenocepacia]|nr:LysM peptidoglycan-binding domain-containing protein [Burkholderia cenocepacia]